MSTYAKVVADSISPAGHRLTTMEVRFHRFVLAEFNTHRVFSRNSASSRAIPVTKQLERFQESPMWPVEWPSEKPGMSGGTELAGEALTAAKTVLSSIHEFTFTAISGYLDEHPQASQRLHKSLLNRPMEWAQRHTVVVSATAWENFFRQRRSPLAQPEIRVAAEMMREAYEASEPMEIGEGSWHLPYTWDDENLVSWAADQPEPWDALKQVSSARCARVSYLTQDGRRDSAEDLKLYSRLVSAEPMHASPLEHVATPAPWNEHWIPVEEGVVGPLPKVGNFLGWKQHRLEVELTRDYAFYA